MACSTEACSATLVYHEPCLRTLFLTKCLHVICRLGEVCSHVAALLFKVEVACRLGYTNPSRTSLPCRWNNDFKTAVSFYEDAHGTIIIYLG